MAVSFRRPAGLDVVDEPTDGVFARDEGTRPPTSTRPSRSSTTSSSSGADQSDPEANGTMLQLVFERVWLDDGHIVAVRPKHAFAPFFQKRAKTRCKERERRASSPGFTPRDIEIR
jgi:hypothetical protein